MLHLSIYFLSIYLSVCLFFYICIYLSILIYVHTYICMYPDDVYRFMETYHADCYKVYNLCSERTYDAGLLVQKYLLTGTKVQMLTQKRTCDAPRFDGRVEFFPRHSIFLLYWYKSTNTDAKTLHVRRS